MSIDQALAKPAAPMSRGLNITLWVFQVLLAALFAFGGINILLGLMPEMVENFRKMGFGIWFRDLTGALELSGAIGLLIPRLTGPAALGLAGVMVGAVLIHLTVLPPASVAIAPAVLGSIFGLIAWFRWPRSRTAVGGDF